MTVATLFTACLALVVLAAAVMAARWLPGRARLATIALLAVWLAFATILGATGVVARTDQLPPGLALLTVPVVVTLLAVTLTAPGATPSRGIPLRLLLGFQVFRVGVELSLYHLWSLGVVPRIMTLAGGNIEILVAATAPVAAWLVSRGPGGRRIAWAWNLVGLLSLGNVVTRAVLSAPGPLELIHAEVPDLAILTYPSPLSPASWPPSRWPYTFSLSAHPAPAVTPPSSVSGLPTSRQLGPRTQGAVPVDFCTTGRFARRGNRGGREGGGRNLVLLHRTGRGNIGCLHHAPDLLARHLGIETAGLDALASRILTERSSTT